MRLNIVGRGLVVRTETKDIKLRIAGDDIDMGLRRELHFRRQRRGKDPSFISKGEDSRELHGSGTKYSLDMQYTRSKE